jgi:hypothetical protein
VTTKQSLFLSLSVILAIVVAAVGSFIAGTRYGVMQYLYLTSPVEGTYSVIMLRTLRNGDVEHAIQTEEARLNAQIAQHWRYRSNVNELLMDQDAKTLNLSVSKNMEMLAQYRKQYPVSLRWSPKDQDDRASADRYISDISDALKFYGSGEATR